MLFEKWNEGSHMIRFWVEENSAESITASWLPKLFPKDSDTTQKGDKAFPNQIS